MLRILLIEAAALGLFYTIWSDIRKVDIDLHRDLNNVQKEADSAQQQIQVLREQVDELEQTVAGLQPYSSGFNPEPQHK